MSLREIPFETRIELLKNQYIYDVTKTSIQFTEEGKIKMFQEFKKGKSVRKVLSELGIIVSPLILEKTKHLKVILQKNLSVRVILNVRILNLFFLKLSK